MPRRLRTISWEEEDHQEQGGDDHHDDLIAQNRDLPFRGQNGGLDLLGDQRVLNDVIEGAGSHI